MTWTFSIMHFDPQEIPDDSYQEEESNPSSLLSQPRAPPKILPNRKPARNHDLDHDSIMNIYQNWQQNRQIQPLVSPVQPPAQPPAKPTAHSQPLLREKVTPTKAIQKEPSKKVYNLSKAKHQSIIQEKPVSPKPPLPAKQLKPPQRKEREKQKIQHKENAHRQDGHRSDTDIYRISDKFKKKLDADIVRDRSLKKQRPVSKDSRAPKANTKLAARRQKVQELDNQLAILCDQQLQLQNDIRTMHKQHKTTLDTTIKKLGIKQPASQSQQKPTKQLITAQLNALSKKLNIINEKIERSQNDCLSNKITQMLYDQNGQMHPIEMFRPQQQAVIVPEIAPLQDARSTNTSYFKSKLSVRDADKKQQGSYYMALQRKKAGIKPQRKIKRVVENGNRGDQKQPILEQSDENQEQDYEPGQVERIKFNQELRNLLFD